MEALLSLAFDNLSGYDGAKIKKGLRQIDGLLAQICLSQAQAQSPKSPKSPAKRSSQQQQDDASPRPKPLASLPSDPAFREFFKLQEGFEWNVAQRLLLTLDRLVAKGGDGQNDLLILSSLDLIQGLLLLHPPSKALFSREQYMNLLLDLIEPINCPAVQCATLLTLVVVLIDNPLNTRTFEALDGLLAATSLFRNRDTTREVKLKLMEFLYFYLMPETPGGARARAGDAASPTKLARAGAREAAAAAAAAGDGRTRTMEDKQVLLGQLLPEEYVAELVRDLGTSAPFGVALKV